MTFSQHWFTDRTEVATVRRAEAEGLTVLFNSSADVGALDPTFRTVGVEEVLGHIEDSQRCEALERGFRMRAIRLKETGSLIGYFHFREGVPTPDVVGLTMFFIRPEFRSRGYGGEVADALLTHLSEDSRNRAAWARVYLNNLPALRFWLSRGFTRVLEFDGRHVHTEGTHASVILERQLR